MTARAVQRPPVAVKKRPLRGASPQRSRSLVVTTPTSCECSPLRSRRTDRAGSEDPSNAGNRRAQKRRVSKPSLRSRCSRNAFVAFPLWLPSSLCVERPEFYVSTRHKKSQKLPSALRSAYQDKRFCRAHRWHLRDCFLKVLHQHPRQQSKKRPLKRPRLKGPVPLVLDPTTLFLVVSCEEWENRLRWW